MTTPTFLSIWLFTDMFAVKDLFSHIETLYCEMRKQRDDIDDKKRLIASFKAENKKYKNDIDNMCHDQVGCSLVILTNSG